MTTFFMALAIIHILGLFFLMFSMRRAPVAIETRGGLQMIGDDVADEAIAVMAKNAV